jgi:hypothetical protein
MGTLMTARFRAPGGEGEIALPLAGHITSRSTLPRAQDGQTWPVGGSSRLLPPANAPGREMQSDYGE